MQELLETRQTPDGTNIDEANAESDQLATSAVDDQAPEPEAASDDDFVISIDGYEADYLETTASEPSASVLSLQQRLAEPVPVVEKRAPSRERKQPRVRQTPLDTLNAHLKGGTAKASGGRGIQIAGLAKRRDSSSKDEEPRLQLEVAAKKSPEAVIATEPAKDTSVSPVIDRRSQLQARLLAEKASTKSTPKPVSATTMSLKDRLARERASTVKAVVPASKESKEKATALMQRLKARLAIEKLQPRPGRDGGSSNPHNSDRRADLLARLEQARLEADIGEDEDDYGDLDDGEDEADLLAEQALRQQIKARLQQRT